MVFSILVLSAVLPAGTSNATTVPNGSLLLVSSPDDPYVGGRIFDTQSMAIVTNTADELFVAFSRHDAAGNPFTWDPHWGIRMAVPTSLEAGTEYPLNGDVSDVLHLTNEYSWQSSACPELTGSATVHEVSGDGRGGTASLMATFTVHCSPEHTVYGSFAFGQDPLPLPMPLPDTIEPIVAAEARFPAYTRVYLDGYAETVALDVHRTKVLLRWDTPGGFGCANASVTRNDESTPFANYNGLDDTWRVRSLDPTARHEFTVSLGISTPGCTPGTASWDQARVLPVRTQLLGVKKDGKSGISVRGRVIVVVPGYAEPARFVEVTVKGRRPDGSVAVLGASQTDVDGYFRLSAGRKHSHRVWAVVTPGSEPAATDSLREFWYHFGDRSPGFRVANR